MYFLLKQLYPQVLMLSQRVEAYRYRKYLNYISFLSFDKIKLIYRKVILLNFLLDMKTIFLILVVGHIFTVLLISAYWKGNKKDSIFNSFFLAKGVQALAWFFLTFRNGIPDLFSISFANSLLFVGASLECLALLKLNETYNKRVKKLYIFLTLFNIIVFHLILFFFNYESYRVAFASFGTAIVIILPVYYFLQKKETSFLKYVIGLLYLFVIISLLGRGVAALLSNYTMGLFTANFIQTLSFIALFLVMLLGNIGFILLLKERTDHELVKMASCDDLTQALNRRTFIANAVDLIERNRKEGLPVSMLLFDIDRFKGINDKYGHEIGDRVLQDVSNQINHLLGMNGLFGRYGGDEFAIFLPSFDDEQSSQFAERIKQEICRAKHRNLPTFYTLSIGVVTVIPTSDTDMKCLYIACDEALYKAKKKGRDRFERGYLSSDG